MAMSRYTLMIYNTLAKYYDTLVRDEEATRAYVDWIVSFEPESPVLELACGSGEITHALSALGYDMSALDLSARMIEKAKQKDPDKKISFTVQDMLDLSDLGTFKTIFCVCDSFNYVLEKEDVKALFKEAASHLETGGLFCFDTHSLDRLDEFEGEYNETGQFEDGVQYQWSIMSEDEYIYQDFAFYRLDGTVLEEHHMQRVYDPEFLIQELEEYFDVISVKTDFDQEGISEGEKYFFAARKSEAYNHDRNNLRNGIGTAGSSGTYDRRKNTTGRTGTHPLRDAGWQKGRCLPERGGQGQCCYGDDHFMSGS